MNNSICRALPTRGHTRSMHVAGKADGWLRKPQREGRWPGHGCPGISNLPCSIQHSEILLRQKLSRNMKLESITSTTYGYQ